MLRHRQSVWIVRRGQVQYECELVFHGESHGWEACVLRNGRLTIGHRFTAHTSAAEWAEQERRELEADGWRAVTLEGQSPSEWQ